MHPKTQSSLLFIIYFNDLFLSTSLLNTIIFADLFTNLWYSHQDIKELLQLPNEIFVSFVIDPISYHWIFFHQPLMSFKSWTSHRISITGWRQMKINWPKMLVMLSKLTLLFIFHFSLKSNYISHIPKTDYIFLACQSYNRVIVSSHIDWVLHFISLHLRTLYRKW